LLLDPQGIATTKVNRPIPTITLPQIINPTNPIGTITVHQQDFVKSARGRTISSSNGPLFHDSALGLSKVYGIAELNQAPFTI